MSVARIEAFSWSRPREWSWVGKALGRIDFFRHPELGRSWGGPFNGQKSRETLFNALIEQVRPAAIIETGTYRGTTTELLAKTGLPVFTIEGHARNYGFARSRLRRRRNVNLLLGDSRKVLRSLLSGPLHIAGDRAIFFYLDAHWNEDLPLAEEIDLAFGQCPGAIVMIDDFAVPEDPGYTFDDYGPGKRLDADYIAPAVETHELAVYYPSTPSVEETGARRGCVVLCKGAIHGEALAALSLLRRAPALTSASG